MNQRVETFGGGCQFALGVAIPRKEVAQFFLGNIRHALLEIDNKGFIHHPIHCHARGIKRAGGFAGDCLRFRIVGAEQVLENMAEQFRVERDFFLDGGVFSEGEFEAPENFQ